MMVSALAVAVSFRMQCLYHDSNGAAILEPSFKTGSGWRLIRWRGLPAAACQIWEINSPSFRDL